MPTFTKLGLSEPLPETRSNKSVLGLDLPSLSEIKAQKSVRFPETGASNVVTVYPNMNSLQDAILRAISPQSEPSDDPHLSSLVAAGVTWLANTLPEPDIQVKKGFLRKRNGKPRDDSVIEAHRLYELLDRPNPHTSGSTLWKAFAYSWIIRGNVYFLKFRNAFGQVVQLWYEPHFNIVARWVNDRQGEYIPAERSTSHPSVRRDDRPNQFINYYELSRDGQKYRIEPQDVIHFRDGIDPFSPRYGISRLHTILREIYGDSAAAYYAGNLLGGNSVIPYVLGIDDKDGVYSQEDLDNVKARLLAQTTGKNAGQPLVLSNRVTFSRTGLTPSEIDLRTSRMMAQDTFAQVTGIPAVVLNFSSGAEHMTYNNMSEADRRAVQSYLIPLWWHRDQEFTHQLLRDIDSDETHFVESDLSEVAVLQEDENAKWTRVGKAYQDGILKRSEARQAIGYEAAENDADEVYYVRTGSETVTLEEEQVSREASIEATQNPPEPSGLPEGPQPRMLTEGQQPLRIAR